MSTKTTFKRIALVAVASLGFGVLGSVTANAAAGDITVVTAVTSASATQLTVTPTLNTSVLCNSGDGLAWSLRVVSWNEIHT